MFYQEKLVLVTGGTGFVGSHLVRTLLASGARVRIPVHIRPPAIEHERVEYVSADLRNREECLAAAQGVDYLFHAAGSVGAAGVDAPGVMASITENLILTARVLQAAWEGGVSRALFFSSSTGYPAADHPVREEELWQGDPDPTYFGYGWMRRYIERLSEYVAAQSPLKIALVRPTAVYGPGDNFNPRNCHVIPALIRRAVNKEDPFVVWGTGEEVRDFLHVGDLARGCLLMLKQHATCDPVNLGFGRGVTIREVVRIILQAAGHTAARVVMNGSRANAISFRAVDTSKAARLLGFTPQISLPEGLAETLRWYQDTIAAGEEAAPP